MASHLNLTEADLKRNFDHYDKDHSGHITTQEFKMLYQKMGINVSDSAIKYLVSKYDKDGDGQIGFPEFYELITGKPYTGSIGRRGAGQQFGGQQGGYGGYQHQGGYEFGGQHQQGGFGGQQPYPRQGGFGGQPQQGGFGGQQPYPQQGAFGGNQLHPGGQQGKSQGGNQGSQNLEKSAGQWGREGAGNQLGQTKPGAHVGQQPQSGANGEWGKLHKSEAHNWTQNNDGG